jgi:hypothetical protein
MEIIGRNVNDTLEDAIWRLKSGQYEPEPSRNGRVLAFPEPVMTTYLKPEERVVFSSMRDANPIFHLLESIWMLAGREDVAFLKLFNGTIGQFSDDGEVFNAAYGKRWRSHFKFDQLSAVIETLRNDPKSRQAVIQMWDASDFNKLTKDKACNMSIVFDCRGGKLNMTVMNRSNDLWWGAYGANAVHMSFLQEFVAHAVGVPIGVYRQFSNNLHLYLDVYDGQSIVDNPMPLSNCNYYRMNVVSALPIMLNADYKSFLRDCEKFCDNPFSHVAEYTHPFFLAVAHPMAMVSRVRKADGGTGRGWAARIQASDWRLAALEWIDRRELKKQSLPA